MMDFRGRIYPRVTYLNYQGSELAKSLLLFSRPPFVDGQDASLEAHA
jgi:DNA-directed RNA polymerase